MLTRVQEQHYHEHGRLNMFENRSAEFQAFMKSVYQNADWLKRKSQTVEGVREVMDDFIGAIPLADDVTVDHQQCNGILAERIGASNSCSDQVFLYIHGGCYISGSPGVVREFCARLARATQCHVLCVDYRLAPEHPFPAALEDVVAAYQWLLAEGYRPESIVVGGESAGGGLTFAMLIQCLKQGLPMPAAAVPISPWVDMEVSFGESLKRNEGVDMAPVEPLRVGSRAYAGEANQRNPLASPLYADLSGLPSLLIQVGTNEVLLDEGLEIARRAKLAGCDVTLQQWQDMTHVWHWYASIFPEAQEAIEAVGAWVRERLGS